MSAAWSFFFIGITCWRVTGRPSEPSSRSGGTPLSFSMRCRGETGVQAVGSVPNTWNWDLPAGSILNGRLSMAVSIATAPLRFRSGGPALSVNAWLWQPRTQGVPQPNGPSAQALSPGLRVSPRSDSAERQLSRHPAPSPAGSRRGESGSASRREQIPPRGQRCGLEQGSPLVSADPPAAVYVENDGSARQPFTEVDVEAPAYRIAAGVAGIGDVRDADGPALLAYPLGIATCTQIVQCSVARTSRSEPSISARIRTAPCP